jgi:hypothetical protein
MSKIVDFIDRAVSFIGERMNPITVFELRRQFNLVNHGIYFAVLYGILGILPFFVLLFPAKDITLFLDRIASTDITGFAVILLLFQFWIVVMMTPIGMTTLVQFFKIRDSLIFLAIDDIEVYRGVFYVGLYYMFKSFCLFFFWVVCLYLLGLITFDILCIFPIIWMSAVTIGNIFFSFIIIFLTKSSIRNSVIIVSFSLVVFGLMYVNVKINYIFSVVLISSKQLIFIKSLEWFPVVIAMFIIYFFVIWTIINFNLNRRRSIRQKLSISILVYLIIIVTFFIAVYFYRL